MHKKIFKLFLVGLAIFSCGFAWTKAVFWSDPDYIRQIGVYGYNPYTQSISNNVLASGLPLTQALGLTKNFFYFENEKYWWWGYRGTPYIYGGNDCQGYALYYKICTPIISGNNNPSDCTQAIPITTGSSQTFGAFLKKVNNEDYYYFNKRGADYGTTWTFCISSVEANSSLCRDWSNCNLGTSLGYSGVNFDTYQNYWGDNSPGKGNTNTENTGTGSIGNTANTGSICPSIRFTIDMYGIKYNTGLCYSNAQQVSGGTVEQAQQISIFDAFNSYQEYRQAYNLIAQNCHTSTVNTIEECQQTLQAIGKKPSEILLKVIQAQLPTEKVYQYCHLQLDFTEEEKRTTGICRLTDEQRYATGVKQQESGPNPLEGISNALQESSQEETPVPEDGTVFDEILPDGVLTRKDVIMDYKFYGHFATLYTKITKLFQNRGKQDGIIPEYITGIIALIILFKIYKK